MNVAQFVDQFLRSPSARANVTSVRHLQALPPRWAEFPPGIDGRLTSVAGEARHRATLHAPGRSDQPRHGGRNVVVVTPTASGKTLCYNLPVLEAILNDPTARALYLFPTKALAQDQLGELSGLVETLDVDIKTYTYDGDTPADARRAVRAAGHIVVTNPDMLHTGDPAPPHAVGQPLREPPVHRHRRAAPRTAASSAATSPTCCGACGGSARSTAHPAVHLLLGDHRQPRRACGRRLDRPAVAAWSTKAARRAARSSSSSTTRRWSTSSSASARARARPSRKLAGELLANDVQTIVFARSRLSVEMLLSVPEASWRSREARRRADTIQGYRGGYLPNERRGDRARHRDGEIRGVVATNALELGIDIGGLEAAVLTATPARIASAWQQMGRAGRASGTSLAILVATSSPLDQYIVDHPDYFFGAVAGGRAGQPGQPGHPGQTTCVRRLRAAVRGRASSSAAESTEEILRSPGGRAGASCHAGGRWSLDVRALPGRGLSLRTAAIDNFVIIDTSRPAARA